MYGSDMVTFVANLTDLFVFPVYVEEFSKLMCVLTTKWTEVKYMESNC